MWMLWGIWSQVTWALVAVNFCHSQCGMIMCSKQPTLLSHEVTCSSCWAQEPEPLPQPPAPQLQPLALPQLRPVPPLARVWRLLPRRCASFCTPPLKITTFRVIPAELSTSSGPAATPPIFSRCSEGCTSSHEAATSDCPLLRRTQRLHPELSRPPLLAAGRLAPGSDGCGVTNRLAERRLDVAGLDSSRVSALALGWMWDWQWPRPERGGTQQGLVCGWVGVLQGMEAAAATVAVAAAAAGRRALASSPGARATGSEWIESCLLFLQRHVSSDGLRVDADATCQQRPSHGLLCLGYCFLTADFAAATSNGAASLAIPDWRLTHKLLCPAQVPCLPGPQFCKPRPVGMLKSYFQPTKLLSRPGCIVHSPPIYSQATLS